MKRFDNIALYKISTSLVTIVNLTNYTIITRKLYLNFLASKCRTLGNGLASESSFKIGNFTVKELTTYSLVAFVFTIALGFFLDYFLISWEAKQLVFARNLVIKTVSAFFHGLIEFNNEECCCPS